MVVFRGVSLDREADIPIVLWLISSRNGLLAGWQAIFVAARLILLVHAVCGFGSPLGVSRSVFAGVSKSGGAEKRWFQVSARLPSADVIRRKVLCTEEVIETLCHDLMALTGCLFETGPIENGNLAPFVAD